MYRSLDSERIVETAQLLCNRISERFPGSGLSKVGKELLSVCQEAAALSRWLSAPHRPLRVGVGVCMIIIVLALLGGLFSLDLKVQVFSSISDFLQGLEAAINEIVFLGIAVFFLLTAENRIKRSSALKAIHVLRSIAHIIDMHQLTKDPDRVMGTGADTPSSPKRVLTPFELTRYLDYCSELLAIISKIAALYVQNFNDPITLSAVNEVENLTNGLSRKIWQKIMIQDRMLSPPAERAMPAS
jgi:hypothetical protein